jgi:hypothetical protein
MGSLFSGIFLTGFALAMGGTRFQIGVLFAIPAISGFAQLLGSYWLERFGGSKRLCVVCALLSRLLYVPVLVVPLVATGWSGQTKVWWIIGLMAASHLLGSLGGVGWLVWIKSLVPSSQLVPFLGRRHLVNTGLSFVVCLAAGGLADWLNSGTNSLAGFIIVFAIAMICGLVGWGLLSCISPSEENSAAHMRPNYRTQLLATMSDANFRGLVGYFASWNLAVNLAAPFIPVYLLQKLGLPLWYVVTLTTMGSLIGLLVNGLWIRLVERFGMKPVLFAATFFDSLLPLSLVFLGREQSYLLWIAHLVGLFNTPIAIAPDHFILKLTPRQNASSYMALFRAVVGPATALAAVIGGLFVSWGQEIAIGGQEFPALRAIFLISFLGRIGSLVLLNRIYEPGATSVWEFVTSIQHPQLLGAQPPLVHVAGPPASSPAEAAS